MSDLEQLSFFPSAIDLARVIEFREVLMTTTMAPNTLAAYRSGWLAFERWCVEAHKSSLPAEPETVILFVAHSLQKGYRLETVRVQLSGIKHRHREAGLPIPCGDELRQVLANAGRVLKERPQRKAALTPDHLKRLGRYLKNRGESGIRDAAILVCGFAAGWRRSELSSLDLEDVAFDGDRSVTLSLGASKADQQGKGRIVTLPAGKRVLTCPVRTLRRWIEVRGRWKGSLFVRSNPAGGWSRDRISGEAICEMLQGHLAAIGEDASLFGGHSLRAGMATSGAENGGDIVAIMQRGGWKSMSTVLRYIRPAQAFRNDPLAGVL